MKIENVPAYEQVLEQEIPDIHAKGSLWKHKKSGARVMVLETEDENKVFNIAFRTPPANSTGVAAYFGTQCPLWFKRISVKRSICRTGKGFLKHIFKCDDLSR